METKIKKINGINKVRFTHGIQTFTLDADPENLEHAKWYKAVLEECFKTFEQDILNNQECSHPFEKVISAGALHNCTQCGENIKR